AADAGGRDLARGAGRRGGRAVTTIPLADARALAGDARRTLAVRTLLAVLVAGAVVAAVFAARSPHGRTVVGLPDRADAVLVLDLSASIASDTYSRIGSTLSALSRSHGRYGLVVFSDQAYEALPPGSPAADLVPLVRYFVPEPAAPGYAPTYPRNPWTAVFSAGTRISSGLELAHAIATRAARRRPTVVLVSDLDDDPGDLARLVTVVAALRRDRVPLHVVALNPSLDDSAFFRQLLGPSAPIVQSPPPAPRRQTPVPWLLLALACAGALALAAHELWAARLTWEPSR